MAVDGIGQLVPHERMNDMKSDGEKNSDSHPDANRSAKKLILAGPSDGLPPSFLFYSPTMIKMILVNIFGRRKKHCAEFPIKVLATVY